MIQPDAAPEPDERLSEIVVAYLQACRLGQAPPQSALLAAHPDLADELREFLADHARLSELAGTFQFPPCSEGPPAAGISLRYVGDYELLEEIARGGMGVVFRARQVSLNRTVAVKMILTGCLASPSEVQRFRTEVELAGQLDHPNIVPIYEVNEYAGEPYFSMKLIEGRSLRQALEDPGWKADTRQRVALLASVARAVHHAHQRGIIHRDLKPANILLGRDGQPHVTDFGLARRSGGQQVTQTGAIVGTPAYMAPEQTTGERDSVTTLVDVYSLGTILYELLTGQPPFTGSSVLEVIEKVRTQEPVPPGRLHPGLDRDLEAICLHCLARNPAQRYPSAAALADDLEHSLQGEPISISPPSLPAQVAWLRKNVRSAVWLVGVGVLGTLLPMFLCVLPFVLPVMNGIQASFREFPEVEKPALLILEWSRLTPDPGTLGLFGFLLNALAALMAGGLGLLTLWAGRTRDFWSDLTAGLGVGMVSGLTAFFAGVAQGSLIALVMIPQVQDLGLLTDGCFIRDWRPELAEPWQGVAHPAEQLQEKYPTLKKAVSDKERARAFFGYLNARMAVGLLEGLWLAGLTCLLLGVVNVVCQTLAAGLLWRRHGWSWKLLLPYAELTLMSWAAALPLVFGLLRLVPLFRIDLLAGILLAGVAWRGVVRRWRFVIRLGWYGVIWCGGFCLADLLGGPTHEYSELFRRIWVGGLVVAALGLTLLALEQRWRKTPG